MRKIDRETTQRILDAADIVEVVSDFVTLKKRGANYIGLCPFHNERTPSFSVSKAKGICKCFSCGKGGSPVNFLMELEQMTYQDALRWLARKYHIEIKEREVSDQERQQEQERESMLAVNDFAMKHFEHVMADTEDGRNIGMAYFRERGLTEASCRKFHLGYSLERGSDLYHSATKAGYNEKFLIATGLCAQNDKGVYDRFRGRVIYPVFSVSGRVVAFGGRTLRTDKSMAKYVNSPESIIYSKSRELYGLYQAKQAIVRQNKCILVEGYMDVISMHQAGVENVVASSGTSLTEGQIRLIHRFTENITVIYDSDAAGVKASLRGIDMLLAEGMNVKVLSLPDGDDPDSYAQSHTNTEVEQYLSEHEVDFISFKSDILLKDSGGDPIRRAHAIADIVQSISVIPDSIVRQVYIQECARRFAMDEKVLSLQVSKRMADNAQQDAQRRTAGRQEQYFDKYVNGGGQRPTSAADDNSAGATDTTTADGTQTADSGTLTTQVNTQENIQGYPQAASGLSDEAKFLQPFEHEVLRYALRYGVMHLCDAYGENDELIPLSVLQYIAAEMADDDLQFTVPAHARLYEAISAMADRAWADASAHNEAQIAQAVDTLRTTGTDEIRQQATSLSDIKAREVALDARIADYTARARNEFARHFIERPLCSSPDDELRRLAIGMASDRYTLSKMHTKYTHVDSEDERLADLVPRALYELKNAILTWRVRLLTERIQTAAADPVSQQQVPALIKELMDLNALKSTFAKYLGERIITPPPRR